MSNENQYPKELIENGSIWKCDFCLESYPLDDLKQSEIVDSESYTIVFLCENCFNPKGEKNCQKLLNK